MVTTEEEMLQKDKEAAVLKANHKHQMVLNIELDRIEKCRRTYESAHHFEVQLVQARGDTISQKQALLRRTKSAGQDNRLATSGNDDETKGKVRRTKSAGERGPCNDVTLKNGSSSGQLVIREDTFDCKDAFKKQNAIHKQYRNPRSISCQGRIQFNRNTWQESATEPRSALRKSITPLSGDENGKRLSHAEAPRKTPDNSSAQKTRKKVVKFPELTKYSETERMPENPVPEELEQLFLALEKKRISKKSQRKNNKVSETDTSSFDQYRLKLHESEVKQRKSKPQLLRGYSVLEKESGARNDQNMFQTPYGDRRARSVPHI